MLFLIIGAGFAGGYAYFKYQQRQETAAPASKMVETIPNDLLYYYSPPSSGVILHTAPFDVPKGTLMPIVTLSNEEAAKHEVGEQIAFYDKAGRPLDMVGEVTAILPFDKRQTQLLILIRTTDLNNLQKVAESRLAVSKESNVPRLPPSAIVTDSKGKEFLWELANERGGMARATKKPANLQERRADFVVIEPDYGSSNHYILNPDQYLTDGQFVRVEKKYYQGPLLTESEAAMKKFESVVKEREHTARMIRQARRDMDRAQLNGGQGCPSQPSEAAAFIEKVRAMGQADRAMEVLMKDTTSEPLPISRPVTP